MLWPAAVGCYLEGTSVHCCLIGESWCRCSPPSWLFHVFRGNIFSEASEAPSYALTFCGFFHQSLPASVRGSCHPGTMNHEIGIGVAKG